MEKTMKEETKKIVDQLEKASDAYYNDVESILTDEQSK
jgi:hypothetical protein